jgi:hypothetical protein
MEEGTFTAPLNMGRHCTRDAFRQAFPLAPRIGADHAVSV